MPEQLIISLVERQRCAIEFWNPTTHPSSLWTRCNETSCGFQMVEALQRRRNERARSKSPVPLSSLSLRQTVCSTFSRSGRSDVRIASLAKGGTSKKRPSPHLHKVPNRNNKVSPRTFQTALVYPIILVLACCKCAEPFTTLNCTRFACRLLRIYNSLTSARCRVLLLAIGKTAVPPEHFIHRQGCVQQRMNNTRSSHVRSFHNPHASTAKHLQSRFSVNIWCGVLLEATSSCRLYLKSAWHPSTTSVSWKMSCQYC
jgi:hypothetical protein